MSKFEFIELVNKYLDSFPSLDEKTKYNKEKRLEKHLYPYLKHDICIFNEDTIKNFVEEKRGEGYKDSSIREYLSTIREFLEWANEKGYLTARYDKEAESRIFRGIRYKNKQKKEIEIYTDEELEIVDKFLTGKLDGIPKPPIYAILTGFLLHTGLRLSEALNVKLSDISLDIKVKEENALQLLLDREIYERLTQLNQDYEFLINKDRPLLSVKALSDDYRKQVIKDLIEIIKEENPQLLKDVIKEIYTIRVREAKFGKERVTKMLLLDKDPVFKERFKGFLKYQEIRKEKEKADDIYLFSYEIKEGDTVIKKVDKLKESTVKTAFSRYSKELKRLGYNIDIKAHTFRRTYATRLAEEGYPIEAVKELLGHEGINTTSKYYLNTKKLVEDLI